VTIEIPTSLLVAWSGLIVMFTTVSIGVLNRLDKIIEWLEWFAEDVDDEEEE